MATTIITEDYVSFEVAKLLNEKGFKEDTMCIYVGRYLLIKGESTISNTTNMPIIPAPTLQMAIKWLRKQNLFVWIGKDSMGYWFRIQDNTTLTSLSNVICGHATYEEAVEAALNYCLTNLIK